jgi:tetraacyldisaccharide 4'-kinase
MKKTITRWLENMWYNDLIIGTWLMPLGFLFSDIARFRRFLYRIGVLKTHVLPVPVIIVGNITVGGTGKTPLTIWLAQLLREAGYKAGVISRGYGGDQHSAPQWVDSNSTAAQVGDEAVLIAKHSGCPVAVSPDRAAAARLLLERAACDVIISDDGLQHYALARSLEIAVIDGERRFGNGYCLPAGPLREPINRLQTVDFIVVNGTPAEDHEIAMRLTGDRAVNLLTGELKPLSEFAHTDCHALAGIGNPERFFKHLAAAGLRCQNHAFPDHHRFNAGDLDFGDQQPVFMTEKDAVKCNAFAHPQHWAVPVSAELAAGFAENLLTLLQRKAHDR